MPGPDTTPSTGGVSIAIVTYAAAAGMLEAAVESVIASIEGLAFPVEVEVIDNGDTAIDRLAHLSDRVTVTSTGRNGGFAAAVNTGFRHGVEHGARFLVCLNDDVVVTPDWLAPLVDALERNPDLGGVQPLLVNPATGLIDSAGVEIDRFGAGSDRLRGKPVSEAQLVDVTALTGGAMMVRSALVGSIGYLDERFFLYYEDVEWSQRATALGWRFAVVPDSVVHHIGSATTAALGDRLVVLQERNRLWNASMHLTHRQILSAIGLSVRRLRHRPRRAHAHALALGATGMAPRLVHRWRRGSTPRRRDPHPKPDSLKPDQRHT